MSMRHAAMDFTYADELIGRPVIDRDGQSAGRIEEIRLDKNGSEWRVVEYVLGIGGLLERLNVGVRLMVGGRIRRRVAGVEQLDISDPRSPRLRCSRDELKDG